MRIGFDLDGVIRRASQGSLNMARQLKKQGRFDEEDWAAADRVDRWPQLNPRLFAKADDEVLCSFCSEMETFISKWGLWRSIGGAKFG